MGKILNRRLISLDQRQKAWEDLIRRLPSNANPKAYRKPGSRSGRK